MTWWQALVLGIVEGLTEYLPVSSTGHLILTAWLLGMAEDEEVWQAAFAFNIVIQGGAIAAVLGLYRQRIKRMAVGLIGRDDQGRRLALNLVIAFLPAALLGLLLNRSIERHLNGPWPVVGALFVGGGLMLAVARSRRLKDAEAGGRELEDMDGRMALLIGLAQCVAMWPGTSRSMMTIVPALLFGFRPRAAAEFSFLLGLITLSAATVYKGAQEHEVILEQFGLMNFLIGFLAATISAAVAIKWFIGFLTKHGLAPFGWYRLGIAGFLAMILLTDGESSEVPDMPQEAAPIIDG
jgi:undecaprenyl-diphosphatase